MADIVVAVYICAASIFTVVASFALLVIIGDAYGRDIKKLLRRKKGGEDTTYFYEDEWSELMAEERNSIEEMVEELRNHKKREGADND